MPFKDDELTTNGFVSSKERKNNELRGIWKSSLPLLWKYLDVHLKGLKENVKSLANKEDLMVEIRSGQGYLLTPRKHTPLKMLGKNYYFRGHY
jgi:hypothetical protein